MLDTSDRKQPLRDDTIVCMHAGTQGGPGPSWLSHVQRSPALARAAPALSGGEDAEKSNDIEIAADVADGVTPMDCKAGDSVALGSRAQELAGVEAAVVTLPAPWAAVWLPVAKRCGAVVVGEAEWRECSAARFEPVFPEDFPETKAYRYGARYAPRGIGLLTMAVSRPYVCVIVAISISSILFNINSMTRQTEKASGAHCMLAADPVSMAFM